MLGSFTPMNRNRIIAIILFSFAALIVWFTFLFIMAEEIKTVDKILMVGGAISSVVSTSCIAYWLSPKIYETERTKKATSNAVSYGVAITFLSYLLGAIIFGIGSTIFGLLTDPNYTSVARAIEGALLTIIVGGLYAIIYMSPGLILGGLTGVFYNHIVRNKSAT